MPGIKQLEQFRQVLSNLGHEREIAAERGEIYDEYPRPSEILAAPPQVDVDDLLSSIGPDVPPSAQEPQSFFPDSEFASETEVEATQASTDYQDDFNMDSFFSNSSFSPPESEPETPVPEAPALEEFDDFLSSLPLDNSSLSEGSAEPEPSDSPEDVSFDDFSVPQDLLAGFANDIEAERGAADSPDDLSANSFELPDFGAVNPEPPDADFPSGSFDIPGPEDLPGSLDSMTPETDLDDFGLEDAGPETVGLEDLGDAGLEDLGLEAAGLENLGDAGLEDLGLETAGLEDLGDAGLEDLGLEAAGLEDLGDSALSDFSLPPADLSGDFMDAMDLSPGLEDGIPAPASFELPDLGGSDFGNPFGSDEPPRGDSSQDDVEALDFSPGFEDGIPAAKDVAFPSMDDEPAPFTQEDAPANPFGDEFADFSIPDDLQVEESSDSSAGDADLDGFDGFVLDENFLQDSIDSALPDDEFHIPGFSDFTSSPVRTSISEIPESAISRKNAKKEVRLELTDSEFEKFLGLLSDFPLNLRMAVEEYLAGSAGTDIHKMEMVHSILGGTSVRKIARTLEGALDRSIPIPKDFEKKSAEQLEAEKSSLRYVFFNKILPVAVISFIGLLLAACTFYLSWQFIYRPLAAESLYKRGYQAIEDERYTQAIDLFNQAVVVWEKKGWYFKYARAFRDKRQYISAEHMYEGLLARYRNDLPAGLEYAEMLRSDMRNYAKAVEVLRRRVLDHHVNNREGLLLLGDTYLDWAWEDPSKYADARLTYASLIELYGKEDPFLARMMRYFIRTDNLAEVLPLKEHFMEKKRKIGASDLVELSGYLVDKRYNPKPGDSAALVNRIEDVLKLLERAAKADPSIPEAHYNLGRYYIYNYRAKPAELSLQRSLSEFSRVRSMSPRRVLVQVDCYRLLGELLTEDREYLDARRMFTEGITLYRAHRETRTVRQDPLVGRLYSDYADIDYFISNDLENARDHYRLAIAEGYDTPSVRYRIGYSSYRLKDYPAAIESFIMTHAERPQDRNLLFSMGNALHRRGDYFAAQGYYERLQEVLESERIRKGILFPQVRTDHGDFVQLYMQTSNNLGVTLNRIAQRTGNIALNGRALALMAESSRAWDALTRNPDTLVRVQGSNLAYLNIQNITRPAELFVPETYPDIPKTLENERILQQRVDQ